MPSKLVMKMHFNSNPNKPMIKLQLRQPPQPSQPPPLPKKSMPNKSFGLIRSINTPMKLAISQNAGKTDCGCGGRH